MKDLTLKFADRAGFSAFMESTGYYDDESMQDDILIDVWICPYISRHLLSLNPLQARCRRYSRGER
ncbi:hypothetical protein HC634_24310 [Escherichia coli]|nr:hypothetical protein [Escherichia coli]